MLLRLLLGIVGDCFGYYKQREEHKASKFKVTVGLSNRVERIPVWEYCEKRHLYFRTLVGVARCSRHSSVFSELLPRLFPKQVSQNCIERRIDFPKIQSARSSWSSAHS